MNNVEVFYKRLRILESIEGRSYLRGSFFFRMHVSGDLNAMKIVLNDDLVKALKDNEKMEILEIMQSGLNDMREKIENHLIDSLRKSLEVSRKRVEEDFNLSFGKEKG